MASRLFIGALCATALLAAPRGAAAQLCGADDAGEMCSDDAGLEGDGGLDDDDAGTAGPADAGRGPGAACSCDARSEKGGSIHVCTGSFDSDVCATFTCERGEVWQRPCSTEDVKLCCEMPGKRLYANLYDDCTHPNCRAGFFAQCQDFGGSVYEGPCREQLDYEMRNPSMDDKDDDDDGWCSVTRGVGAGATPGLGSAGLLGALALLGLRRGRRRG